MCLPSLILVVSCRGQKVYLPALILVMSRLTQTKKVPVQDTASLFRSLNTKKDTAHTNPNKEGPCSGHSLPFQELNRQQRQSHILRPFLPLPQQQKKLNPAQDTTSSFEQTTHKHKHQRTSKNTHTHPHTDAHTIHTKLPPRYGP